MVCRVVQEMYHNGGLMYHGILTCSLINGLICDLIFGFIIRLLYIFFIYNLMYGRPATGPRPYIAIYYMAIYNTHTVCYLECKISFKIPF